MLKADEYQPIQIRFRYLSAKSKCLKQYEYRYLFRFAAPQRS